MPKLNLHDLSLSLLGTRAIISCPYKIISWKKRMRDMSTIQISTINYNGWKDCISIKNGIVELIVTTEVGPRIIYFAHTNGSNVFHQRKEQQGLTNSDEWLSYGGHRLWHSPQAGYRPNQPDNVPIEFKIESNAVVLTCKTEEKTGVQKKMRIKVHEGSSHVTVTHYLYNRGIWPIEMAAWALSVMKEGGIEIFPIPQNDTIFMPNYMISFWPWTKPNDLRFQIGRKYLLLRQDISDESWFKIGLSNEEGWGAYCIDNCMFVKIYRLLKDKKYPDYGANFETFTDNYMLELETLSPLQIVDTNQFIEHTEEWYLFDNVDMPKDEADIEKNILPLINGINKK